MRIIALVLIMCTSLACFAKEMTDSLKKHTPVCAACHGPQGISTNPEWPNLAGQQVKYLIKQLLDMKKGNLIDAPTMSALVRNLNQQDIDDLALYYAKMPLATGSTPKKFVARGEQIYRGGDFGKHITACIACHGPQGTGNAGAGFPSLSGQHAAYTLKQLQAFKNAQRKNDLNHIMQGISQRMSQEDMEAVAHYIEGLH